MSGTVGGDPRAAMSHAAPASHAPAAARVPRAQPARSAPPVLTAPQAALGRLVLVPNTLDHATGVAVALDEVLPRAAIARAAGLRDWVVENAKSARSFLRRVDAVVPLGCPIAELAITELPRPPKGGRAAPPAADAVERLLAPLRDGRDVGLLSEAGLPAVADAGAPVVAAAHRLGAAVEPHVGPHSPALALAASGLDGQSFAFRGYLPVEPAARDAAIRDAERLSARLGQTQLAIEAPYRNVPLMRALVATLQPATRLSIACGLTLPGGWCRTTTVAQWRRLDADEIAATLDRPAVFAWLAGR